MDIPGTKEQKKKLLEALLLDEELREELVGDISSTILNEIADEIQSRGKFSYSNLEITSLLRWTGTFISKGRK